MGLWKRRCGVLVNDDGGGHGVLKGLQADAVGSIKGFPIPQSSFESSEIQIWDPSSIV